MVVVFGLLALLSASSSGEDAGTITFYRDGGIAGAAVACPVRHKGREVVELGRGKYAEVEAPAGSYIFTNGTASVEVTVKAGERRYVRCQIKAGFASGRSDFQIVDEETYAKKAKGLKRKDASPLSAPSP